VPHIKVNGYLRGPTLKRTCRQRPSAIETRIPSHDAAERVRALPAERHLTDGRGPATVLCVKRLGLALIAFSLVLALFVPSAFAEVTILNDNGRQVDTITKGGCRVSGKKGNRDFFLTAKSKARKFSLTAFLDAPVFEGFHQTYIAYYGGKDPQIFLHRNSDDEVFSNFKLPGTPPDTLGAGAIAFRKHGRRVGIGLYAASNRSATEGYSFAGAIRCRYSKRR
jgi:hypothetical protein